MLEKHREFSETLDRLCENQRILLEMQNDLYRRIEIADQGINGNINQKYKETVQAIDDASAMLDAHMKILMWESCRKDGEPLEDTKKRIFSSLPKANGSSRLLQMGCAKLLEDFDALCRQNGLSYWIHFGTLLGAIRHGGFIPWDDDVDLGMMRDDIERLLRLLENDARYRITTVYDKWAYCRQIRFWYADESLPCFLDLFIYDYSASDDYATFDKHSAIRQELIANFQEDSALSFWNERDCYLPASDKRADTIAKRFDKAVDHEKKLGLLSEKSEAHGIIWGVDNLTANGKSPRIHPIDDIFPLATIEFEGLAVYAPHNYQKVLFENYGDIYDLPKDIHTHYQHVSDDAMQQASSALKGLLS